MAQKRPFGHPALIAFSPSFSYSSLKANYSLAAQDKASNSHWHWQLAKEEKVKFANTHARSQLLLAVSEASRSFFLLCSENFRHQGELVLVIHICGRNVWFCLNLLKSVWFLFFIKNQRICQFFVWKWFISGKFRQISILCFL